MKKRHIIMLIFTIVIILCIGAGVVFAYFFTDLFKSNKTLFSKYIVKNSELFELFEDKEIKAYSEKQKSTPYSSEGTIKTNVTFPDSSKVQLANALQNCNITFNEKVDNSNNYYKKAIKTNYSDLQSIEYDLYRKDDIFALKIVDVFYKYVGFENNNLKEFATKMQLPEQITSIIPNKINLEDLKNNLNIYSAEEKSALREKYLKIVTDNLTNDMFSKEKSAEDTVYILKINNSQLNMICTKLLEALKEDDIIINKVKEKLINNYNFTEENIQTYVTGYKNMIQYLIDHLNTEKSNQTSNDVSETNIEENTYPTQSNIINSITPYSESEDQTSYTEKTITIKVHSENRKLSKTEINYNDTYNFVITKSDDCTKFELIQNNSEIISAYTQKFKSPIETRFEFSLSKENSQLFNLTTSFSGLDTNSVNESSELTFDLDLNNSTITNSKTKFIVNYKNTKTFGDFQKDEIPNSEILLLNTAPSLESIQTLYSNLESKFIQINDAKLQSIGLTEQQNPLMYYIPSIATVGSIYVIQNPDKASYFSMPLILTGYSISMLIGDNNILNRASKAKVETDLGTIKEQISVDISSKIINIKGSKERYKVINNFLKNFKNNNDSVEYSYKDNKVTLKSKYDSSAIVTGTLSSEGIFKWDE